MTGTPHVRIPSALQFDESLSRGARDLWAVIDELARERIGIEATGPELCAAAGCSPASLRRWRVELVKAGWLHHVASAGGRGVASLWVPLRRARTVRNAVPRPVENLSNTRSETRSGESGSDRGNPLTVSGFLAASNKDRAGEEEQGACGAPRSSSPVDDDRPAWCGVCDARTRRVEVGPGDVLRNAAGALLPVGSLAPCPSCHPSTAPLF